MSKHAATRARYYQENKHKWLEYRDANKEKIKEQKKLRNMIAPEVRRIADVRRKYGVSREEYDAMLAKHDGACHLCLKPERGIDSRTKLVKQLAVDHDHETNKVRGLLCSHCNRAIGLFGDDADLVMKASNYIRMNK